MRVWMTMVMKFALLYVQLIDASKSVGVMVTGPVLSSVTTRLRMTLHKVTLINSTGS